MRVRPFVLYKDSTCTPKLDNQMKHTGSYPSGHAILRMGCSFDFS